MEGWMQQLGDAGGRNSAHSSVDMLTLQQVLLYASNLIFRIELQ